MSNQEQWQITCPEVLRYFHTCGQGLYNYGNDLMRVYPDGQVWRVGSRLEPVSQEVADDYSRQEAIKDFEINSPVEGQA